MTATVALWDSWNRAHIARHGVVPREVDEVLADKRTMVVPNPSQASTRPAIFGTTQSGRPLLIAYDVLDEDVPRRIYPVTAYEPEP